MGLSASRDPPLSGLHSNQGLGSINLSLYELAYNIVLLCPTSDIEYGQSLSKPLESSLWPVGGILHHQWIVLSGLRSLRIASKDGGPSNEYRIQEQSVEFRALDEQGNPYSQMPLWRPLDNDEIKLHFDLQTPVAEWLDKNLYGLAKN
jgi:hypothetical protein